MDLEAQIELIRNSIKSYPDWPKKGVLFRYELPLHINHGIFFNIDLFVGIFFLFYKNQTFSKHW